MTTQHTDEMRAFDTWIKTTNLADIGQPTRSHLFVGYQAATTRYQDALRELKGRLIQNNFVLGNVIDDSYSDIIGKQIEANNESIATINALLGEQACNS